MTNFSTKRVPYARYTKAFGVVVIASSLVASAAYNPAYERVGCAKDPTGALLATGYPTNPAAVENYFIASDSVNRGGLTKAAYCASQCAQRGALFAALGLRIDDAYPDDRGTDVCTCGVSYDPIANRADPSNCKPPSDAYYCDDSAADGQCATQGYASVFKLKNVVECPSDPRYFSVEAPPNGEDAPIPATLSRFCYRFEGSTNAAKSWNEAKKVCESEGGRLATIDGPEENKFILSLPNSINTANIAQDFWVGGVYYGPSNGFEWVTGRMVTFFDWMSGEPATDGGRIGAACLDVSSATPTPVGGSWAARACDVPKRFMCKKYANATENEENQVLPPRVQAIAVGAETACVNQSLVPDLSSGPNLELWLTFDKHTVDTHHDTADDSSSYKRLAKFMINNENAATPFNYTFDINPKTFGETLVFDGNLTAISPSFGLSNNRTLTVTSWVRPTNQSGRVRPYEVIVSKGLNTEETSDPSANWAWALYIKDNRQYCFTVGAKTACSALDNAAFKFGEYTFVSGVYDGRGVSVYINSVQSAFVTAQNAPIPVNSSTPVAIGGNFPKSVSAHSTPARATFEGVLDDVRVFSAALPIGDIEYLDTCALLSPLTNKGTISAYAGKEILLVALGHNLLSGVHRLGLSKVGCAPGTPFSLPIHNPIFMRGYMSTTRMAVELPATQIISGTYDICYTSPNSNDTYSGGVGIKLRVLELTGLNGGKKKVEINTDDKDGKPFVSADVEVNGVNIQNYTVVVLSPFPHCSYSFGTTIGTLINVDGEGTRGTLLVYHAPVNTEYYYLCWAGSVEDAVSLQRVVPTGLVIELTGKRYQSKAVAYNDGTTRVDAGAIVDGFAIDRPNGEKNFFVPCASLAEENDYYFFKVEMGDFVDFIIPAPGRTPCDTLLGASWTDPWSGEDSLYNAAFYSPVDPLSPNYHAQLTQPIPRAGLGALGGSAIGFPIDGRQELSRWGSDLIGSWNTVGGCCQAKLHQESTWGLPYRITGYVYDPNSVYFQVDELPYIVFPNETVSIRLRIVNIYGRGFFAGRGNYSNAIEGGCNFKIVHKWVNAAGSAEVKTYSVNSVNCDYTLRTSLNAANAVFEVEGSLADESRAGKKLVNSASSTFSVRTTSPPYDAYILNSGDNITSMLSFRAIGGLESVIYSTMAINPNLNMFEPSDREIMPQDGQPMTAYDYHKFPTAEYKWTWRSVSSMSGEFGGAAKANGIQYFAFAFYTTVGQNIAFNGGCLAFRRANAAFGGRCAMYVGGVEVRTAEFPVYSGWHQVLIKITNTEPLTAGQAAGFWLSIDGNGLAFNVDKPLGAPEGSTILYEGNIIGESLIYLRNPIVVNSFDESSSSLPNGVPENRMYPTLDGDWFPLSEHSTGVPIHTNTEGTIGKYQQAIHYFGTALFATSAASATFTIPNTLGAVRIYFNGRIVANYPADLNAPTRTVSLSLREGWSQLFFKVSALAGKPWYFKMVATSINSGVLFYKGAIPDTLPAGVVNFKTRPLGGALALLSQSSQQYGLPYDTTNATDPAAANATFTQVNTSRMNKVGDPETVNSVPFIWTQVSARDERTGSIGEHAVDGGGYNRYYSFAMFASKFAEEINVTVEHYEGVGVWFDGQFVGGRVSDNMNGTVLKLVNVSYGWHTVHVRLQAENSLEYAPLSTPTHATARQVCTQRSLTLCRKLSDMCPFDTVRKDIGAPFDHSVWAAIDTDDNKWVQLGDGSTGDRSVCMTEAGDAFDDSIQREFRAACCGTVRPSFFSFSVTGFPKNAVVGWAPYVPKPVVPRPTILTTMTETGVLVNITHINKDAIINYSLARDVYPTTRYTGPFTLKSNDQFAVFVRAVASVDGTASDVADKEIRFENSIIISRDACTAGPDCFMQLARDGNPNAQFSGMLVVAVDTSASSSAAVLDEVVKSSRFVSTANPATATFTTFLSVDDNNIAKIPATFTSREGLSSISIVVFPTNAATRDVQGTLIQNSISVASFLPFVGTAYRGLESSPLAMVGSFVRGDRFAFPELVLSPSDRLELLSSEADICTQTACDTVARFEREREADPSSHPAVRGKIFYSVDFSGADNFFVDTTADFAKSISCACVESRGGLALASNEYRRYGSPSLVTFAAAGENSTVTLEDLPPADSGKNFAIYSFSPSVVEARDTSQGEANGESNMIKIRGNFPRSSTYKVAFECASQVAYVSKTTPFECSNGSVAPTATIQSNDGATLTVYVNAPQNGRTTKGLWTLRLSKTADDSMPNVPLNYAKNFFVAVVPPSALITAADGECAHDSTLCYTGAIITFHGANFNDIDLGLNRIELLDSSTNAISKNVACNVQSVSNSTLVCRLALTNTGARVPQQVRVFARTMSIPDSFGSSLYNSLNGLNIGTQGARGWSGELGPGPAPTPRPPTTKATPVPDRGADDDSGGNKVGIIAAIVCGALLLVAIFGAIFVITKYDLLPKKRKAHDYDQNTISESLNPGQQESV